MANWGITLITQNLGLSYESVILIIVLLGGFVIYAKDFKLGLVIQFITTGCIFMWFYAAGYNYVPALITFFVTFIAMALTLYTVSKTTKAVGFV